LVVAAVAGTFFSMLLTAVWLVVVDRSQLGIAMKLESTKEPA